MSGEAKMVIEKGAFTTKDEVMRDILSTGFWPTTFISNKSPELPVHYHTQDIIGYVMEGTTYLLNEDHERIDVGPGDKLNIPKGAWHAEGEVTERVVYIVSLPEPIPFEIALNLHEPRGSWPPES
jgi:mannose-6-phosphate isomerase-like protein (cupin superfamily)